MKLGPPLKFFRAIQTVASPIRAATLKAPRRPLCSALPPRNPSSVLESLVTPKTAQKAREVVNDLHARHPWMFRRAFIAGGCTTLAVGGLATWYLIDNWDKASRFLMQLPLYRFENADGFEKRLAIYLSLPSFELPEHIEGVDAHTPWDMQAWQSRFANAISLAQNEWLSVGKRQMREKLRDEALSAATLSERITLLKRIYPASLELDLLIDEAIEREISNHGWVAADVLNLHSSSRHMPSCELLSKIATLAVASFPGSIPEMVALAMGQISAAQLTQDSGLQKVYGSLQSIFASFHHDVRERVLQDALVMLIKAAQSDRIINGVSARALYRANIQEHLIKPLQEDGNIDASLLDQVREVFLALSTDLQARILLRAIRHPGRTSKDPQQKAELVKDLLAHGGIVAVKLGQLMSESPLVPSLYRELLGSLRDANVAMTTCQFWSSIPELIQHKISAVGGVLGVGSVKQVVRAKLFANDEEVAVAVLRSNVKSEAIVSLIALESDPQLKGMSQQLSRLIYPEFDLASEGDALRDFASTAICRHPLFKVVDVLHSDPRCLILTIARGPTVAKALAASSVYSHLEQQKILNLLADYHRVIFEALVKDGLVHSDAHLGNASVAQNAAGEFAFTLYDIGQVTQITHAEVDAILFSIGAFAGETPAMCSVLQHYACRRLAILCGSSTQQETIQHKLREAINQARDFAMAHKKPDGAMDVGLAYTEFLRLAENSGVKLPRGAFAVAKLLGTVLSQQATYGMPNIMKQVVDAYAFGQAGLIEKTFLAAAELGIYRY